MTGWTLSEFLNHLRTLDIRLALDGDRLACNAPKGALTSEIKTELQRRKSDIIEFLRTAVVPTQSAGLTPILTRRNGAPHVSYSQQRLWFLDQMEPGNPIYNIAGALRFLGKLDQDALERSLREIVSRHESLRTVFCADDGVPRGVVQAADGWRMDIVDLQTFPLEDRETEALHRIRSDFRRPYDLARGPLARATLYVLSDRESILLLGMHHIVSDGWSMGVLVNELRQLYPAFHAGQGSSLAPLQMQFADYAEWHRQWLESGVLGTQIPYWKETLASPLPVLELPLDRPRPPVQTSRGDTVAFSIPASLYESIKQFSTHEQVTLFMTLLTAYHIVLSRHTGQDDIIVGTAVAGRNRPEFAETIGFFVNTLVLRTTLAGNPTVREALQRVRATTLNAFAKQDVPFDRLVEVLKPERALDRPPIFQTMFVLQNWPMTALEFPDLLVKRVDINGKIARYDLSVDAIEHEGTLRLYFEYNTDLFNADSIQRLQQHYQVVLEAMLANPDQHVGSLPLMRDEDIRQMVIDWNNTAAPFPDSSCVHGLIEAQAERTPDAEAVRFGEISLTYRELVQRANQLAHYLRGKGVGPDTLVGICLERSHEMIVALLAVWKAGGAYVPLDPSYPRERLTFMAEDSGLVALMTESALEQVIPGIRCPVICLDRDRDAILAQPMHAPAPVSHARNLAYVLYTSGSTGKPKGVMIEHRSVVNFLCSMQREPALSASDTLMSVTTLSFDIAGLEMYLPLITGARVVLVPREISADGVQLARAMREAKATVMQATPATWRLLLESGWKNGEGLTILCGGEALPTSLADALLETGATVWNLYGPTETTIWSTVHRVRQHEDPVPIGRPIANTQLYVLDAYMQPVPVNVIGELYIGGDGLARGYHNRPELTAERFVPNPFVSNATVQAAKPQEIAQAVRTEAPPQRLYRTGDQVRYRADGTVEYVGRIDDQVKVRGFRIELGEIESVLSMHDAVRQAVVVVREDVPGDQRLVAYLIPASDRSDPALSGTTLRSWLAESIPQYMIPSAFVVLDRFPLTPNGKIDRRALPSPNDSVRTSASAFISPRSDVENAVADIWRAILRVDRVGTNDNFFDLGGHSLLVVQMQSRLRERFGRDISLMDLFRRPTVGAIVEFLSQSAVGNEEAVVTNSARERAQRQNLATTTE